MKFFDRVNLVGRVLVGLFFLFEGIYFLFGHPFRFHSNFVYFLYFVGFWELIGSIFLILGIKPRATAAVLAAVLLSYLLVEIAVAHHSLTPHFGYASFFNHVGIFGALLFIAGTRHIPHGLMIRSEDSMNEKYGSKQ